MRRWLPICLVIAVLLIAVQTADWSGRGEATASTGLSTLYLDLASAGAPGGGPMPLVSNAIPPNCSSWHELYPTYCGTWHQDDYTDNGDGVVSPCDIIRLNGIAYHVVWVGPTYFVTCSTTPGGPPVRTAAFEPVGNLPPDSNPICQVWHEVWPNFCQQIHIDSWHDNGNGILDVCDEVDVNTATGTIFYHIDRIGCNVVVEPVPITPTRQSTWSWLKGLFG